MWKVHILAAFVLAYVAALAVADPYAKLRIFAAKNVTYGERTSIVVAVEDLGVKPFELNVSTTNYIIAYFVTDPNSLTYTSRWYLTLDLSIELQRYVLTKKKAPYKYAYYHIAEAVFWSVGEHELVARLEGNDGQAVRSAQRIRKVLVEPPASWLCVPQIELTHCTEAWRPLHLDTAVPQFFMATITSDCAYDDTMIYKWQLCAVNDQETIIDFGRTSEPTLGVARYRLNGVGLETNGSDVYMLHVTALGRKELPVTAARCYIVLEKRPIEAIIAGGVRRAVKASWKVILSGKTSRDYSQEAGAQSNLLYHWRCASSDDPDNVACAQANGSAPTFELKPNTLQLGKQYNFTLILSSGEFATRSSLATQLISVVTKPYIYLTILCRANCAMASFEGNETVSLQAECLNCYKRARNAYDWRVNGSVIETDRAGAGIIVAAQSDVLDVEVNMSSTVDGFVYVGRAALQLRLNSGPTGGVCQVRPTIGYEQLTNFVINCLGYQTEFAPIEYQFYADDFLLHRCTAQESVTLILPQTEFLNISVCDIFEVCAKVTLPVLVKPLADGITNATLDEHLSARYMNTSFEMMHDYLRRGDWARYMLLTYAKARSAREAAPELFYVLDEEILRLDQLDQIVTIALKNLEAMKPLDEDEAYFLVRIMGKIAVSFANLVEYKLSWSATKHSYYRISLQLVWFLTRFSREAQHLPLTHCHYESFIIQEKLLVADKYEIIPDMDLNVMHRIGNWLEGNRHLDETIQMLGVSAAVHTDRMKIRIKHNCCEMVMRQLDLYTYQELALNDQINRVRVSPMLVDEVKALFDADLTLQMFRVSCNRFWWYPDCRALSTSIITVNLISERSSWNHQEVFKAHLDVYLMLNTTPPTDQMTPENFTIDGGDFLREEKSAFGQYRKKSVNEHEKHAIDGCFEEHLKMKIYITTLKPNSLLVLKVLYTDMPLRIKVKDHKQPSPHEIHSSSCRTGNGSVMKTILSRNPCRHKTIQTYIAFFPDIRTQAYEPKDWPKRNFKFILEQRECNSWQYDMNQPSWSTKYCIPAMQPSLDKYINCKCNVFSTYSATITYRKAQLINVYHFEDEKYIFPLITIYVLLFVLLLLMRFAKFTRGASARNLITECNRRTKENDTGDIIVQIHTGGQRNAGTSSNITLGFYSLQLGERQYVLYQDSFIPQVCQNTTYTLRLSSTDVRLPTLLIVGHDGEGLYPNWYLRSIVIHDLRNDDVQVFPIEKWITQETVLMSSRAFNRAPDALPAYSWRSKFRNYFEEIFINWFCFQPLMGPWRYGSIAAVAKTRYQRSCVWISQIGATICLCLLCVHYKVPSAHITFLNIAGIDPVQICFYNYILIVAIEMLFDRFPLN